MDCRNCGAPMRLVRERDYFVCEYCGSYYFPTPNRDGIRVLQEPSDIHCPLCKINLVLAALDDVRVLHCTKCQGVLIRQADFAYAVSHLREYSKPLPPQPLNRKELERSLACPRCYRKMHTFHYGGGGNVVIDNCPTCQVIWLDYGELARVIGIPNEEDKIIEALRHEWKIKWENVA